MLSEKPNIQPIKITPQNVRQHIVLGVGEQGWYIFRVMADAEASTRSIVKALQRFRPKLSRSAVSRWRHVYNQRQAGHNKAQE